MGGRLCNICEGIMYEENFKVSLFKKMLEHLFSLKLKYEQEGIDLMVDFIKLCMNSLQELSNRKILKKNTSVDPKIGSLKITIEKLLIVNLYQVVKTLLV